MYFNLKLMSILDIFILFYKGSSCQGCAERERSDLEWSGVTPKWKGFDNKSGGTTLASAHALCLDRLSRVWLRISEELNCCQESRRGVI